MENGGVASSWNFKPNATLEFAANLTIRGVLGTIMANLDHRDTRPTIPLGHGDPSAFPCFHTTPIAEDAIISAVRSAQYNSYAPCVGILPARSSPTTNHLLTGAIAEYLSRDLPCELSPDDVFLTVGCTQAIEVIMSVLARPGGNILLPRPGYQFYDARAAFNGVEARFFDLIPEKNWEVDVHSVESVADENTVAMVIVNPGNPCGNVFTYEHLAKVAETAKKLGILVISDEVYAHLTFGNSPFVPMGVFGSVAPVITVGSISKRWVVPGWRLGWLVTNDPKGILKETKIVDCIKNCLNVSTDPATFIQELFEAQSILDPLRKCPGTAGSILSNQNTRMIQDLNFSINVCGCGLIHINAQNLKDTALLTLFEHQQEGAVPQIIGNTREDFFNKTIEILKQTADICYERLKEIDCITCPSKPEASMFVMVKMNLSLLEDILDDVDFCCKLAKEESVVILPGSAVGWTNWLRITFAIDPSSLEQGLQRLRSFYLKHAKKQ